MIMLFSGSLLSSFHYHEYTPSCNKLTDSVCVGARKWSVRPEVCLKFRFIWTQCRIGVVHSSHVFHKHLAKLGHMTWFLCNESNGCDTTPKFRDYQGAKASLKASQCGKGSLESFKLMSLFVKVQPLWIRIWVRMRQYFWYLLQIYRSQSIGSLHAKTVHLRCVFLCMGFTSGTKWSEWNMCNAKVIHLISRLSVSIDWPGGSATI